MDIYLGTILMFGFNFTPRQFAACNGQLLAIAQNSALFSLLGTQFGGDGHTTFALPNLQGRVPMHQGHGPGLTPRQMGQIGGTESVSLNVTQMPAHNHGATVTAQLHGETAQGTKRNPLGAMLATPPSGAEIYADPVEAEDKAMAAQSITATAEIGQAGGNQPFGIMPPFQVVNFCICTEGIFPSRN